MASQPLVPFEGTFDGLIGLVIDEASRDEVHAHVAVRDDLKQPMGLVHGGVFASIAESITSAATWMAVSSDGLSAQGLSNQTSFLRPITEGTIHAVARRRPPPPQRPDHLGVGGRDHRRPGAPLRAGADDDRRAADADGRSAAVAIG